MLGSLDLLQVQAPGWAVLAGFGEAALGSEDQHHWHVGGSAAPPRIPPWPSLGFLWCFSPGCGYQQLRSAFAALVAVSFHTYFLKPPAQGGKDTQRKMNTFVPGPRWGIFLVHPFPGTALSRGSWDQHGHTAAWAWPPFPLSMSCFWKSP